MKIRFAFCLLFLLALLVSVSLGLTSCNETSVPPEPLKLEGTAWKLLYFVDVENNTKRDPEYHKVYMMGDSLEVKPHKLDFTLAFNCDSIYSIEYMRETPFRLSGASIRNYLMCNEEDELFIDYNSNILTARMWQTLVYGETNDGKLYLNIFVGKHSFPFELSADTLKLFYNDKKNCLIFRRFYEN